MEAVLIIRLEPVIQWNKRELIMWFELTAWLVSRVMQYFSIHSGNFWDLGRDAFVSIHVIWYFIVKYCFWLTVKCNILNVLSERPRYWSIVLWSFSILYSYFIDKYISLYTKHTNTYQIYYTFTEEINLRWNKQIGLLLLWVRYLLVLLSAVVL